MYAEHTIDDLSCDDYNDILNLLTIELLIDNAHRAGVILNMTMQEYENRVSEGLGRYSDQGGYFSLHSLQV